MGTKGKIRDRKICPKVQLYTRGYRELSRNHAVKKKARPHPSPPPQGEGELFVCLSTFTNCGSFQPGQMVLPLLGERAGVRANFIFNCIVTALGGGPLTFATRRKGEGATSADGRTPVWLIRATSFPGIRLGVGDGIPVRYDERNPGQAIHTLVTLCPGFRPGNRRRQYTDGDQRHQCDDSAYCFPLWTHWPRSIGMFERFLSCLSDN